jgi:hypothetical protein
MVTISGCPGGSAVRIARRRLEGEPATVGQGSADGGERGTQLVAGDEDVEGVARHDGQRELAVPGHRRRRAGHPFDAGKAPRPGEHGRVGVEPAQPSGMAGLAGPVQQRSGSAADIEGSGRLHHQREIEVVARPPRVEQVVERRRLLVRVHCRSIGEAA